MPTGLLTIQAHCTWFIDCQSSHCNSSVKAVGLRLLYSAPSFSSFSSWEPHRVTNFSTIASRAGLSGNVSSNNLTTVSKIIQCYPHWPSTKPCQGKQVPFPNLCLVKQQTEMASWNRHSLYSDPAPKCVILVFIFRNETISLILLLSQGGSR